jgi:hypothetical protein
VLELLTILVLFGLPLVFAVMLHVTGHRSKSNDSGEGWPANSDETHKPILQHERWALINRRDPISCTTGIRRSSVDPSPQWPPPQRDCSGGYDYFFASLLK